jgi:hypothetical protein
VTKDQLDQLEEHGYLNAGDRGTRADECEAIASLESLWPAHRNLPLRNPVAALRTYFEHHVVLQRGTNEPGPGQERRLYNRGETLPAGKQRGLRERGPVGPTPEQQRSLRDRGASGPSIDQQRRVGPPSGGPATRERGAMGPSPGQERQLFNRAPASPAPGPQRGAGERGPSGPAPGPGGGGQRRGFEQGR